MKKKLQILFIITTLVGFSLPIIRFNKTGTVSEKENRTLSLRPPLVRDGYLNKNAFAEYSAYFDDRFGGRQRLIALNSKLKFDVFKAAIFNENAIRGKGDWWFYRLDGNHDDFYKRNLMSDEQLADFKNRIEKTAAWCKEQNIPCIFLICPNKHSVYEEYYRFKRPSGMTRADQMTAILDKLGVPYLFPRDYLISKKAEYDFPLYYETDTHWNPQGAYLAFTLLREKIAEIFPNVDFPRIAYETNIDHSMTAGDILPMLGVEKSKSTRPTLTPIGHGQSDFYAYLKNEGTKGVHTKGTDSTLPRALIFRDSFFSSLEPFVSPLFSETEYHWKQFRAEDKEYVLEYKPDIIIFESVERYSPNIVQ